MANKILLIDDSELVLDSTTTLLMFEGYDVITASNGTDGISLAKQDMPDLIICDVSMPGISGYEVITAIRADASTATIPFIFLTAYTEKSKQREGMEKGADDFLTKPFTKNELLAAINAQWKRTASLDTKIKTKVVDIGQKLNYALPHEFRTVFSQLMGYINEIRNNIDYLERDDISEACDQMLTVCDRLNKITDNFLLFTKLSGDANSLEIIKELRADKTIEPLAIVSDLCEIISQKYDRYGDVEITNAVTDIAIAIEPSLFNKLIEELIDNALKFSKDSENKQIAVNSTTNDNSLVIVIEDHGIGMTMEQIKDITAFVQFQREENEQQGVGIGLTLAQKIADIHGGTINIVSKIDHGTIVTVALPLTQLD